MSDITIQQRRGEPTEQEQYELTALIAALSAATGQAVAAQERNLRLLRANVRELAAARRILTDSNRMSQPYRHYA